MDKAIILTAGKGTRMRRVRPGTVLTPEQEAVAASGLKALVPVGRAFLDYTLNALADAGLRRVCLVVGPRHEALREYYGALRLRRLELAFAVQDAPRGTADAVAAAEGFAAGDDFAVLNGDNYYPPEMLGHLHELGGPGLVAVDRRRLLARGETNISHERMAAWAVVDVDAAGHLRGIVEKPDAAGCALLAEPVCVSVNCWRFSPRIFEACRAIGPSERGELELPAAVGHARDALGEHFRVVISDAPVLDLSNRGDVAPVAARLASLDVDL